MADDFDLIWDDVCCACRNKNVSIRDERLQVAPCGHKFCRTCGSRLPKRGSTRCPAPGCGKAVARSALSDKPLELRIYERELRVRRKLARIFNKPARAFESVAAYNDYLERVETYVMNLVDEIDVDKTNAEIEKYQAANASNIVLHEAKRANAVQAVEDAVRREKAQAAASVSQARAADQARRRQLELEKATIAGVAVGDVDARTVEVGEDVDPATGVSVNKLGGLTLDQGGAHSGMAFQQSEQPRLVSGAKKLVFRPKPLLRTTDVDMSELCASPGVDVIRWEAELEQSLLLVGTL